METLQDLKDFFSTGYKEYWPNLSVDCVIFGYSEGQLQLLLVKNKFLTKWSLPGGFVKKTESLDEASARITKERTGIQNLFLEQFKTYGDPGRNFVQDIFSKERFFETTGVKFSENAWFSGHAISVGFYAITDMVKSIPKPDYLSEECRWFPLYKLPKLAFDHNDMVREALFTMRIHLYHYPIGLNLLQKKFTLKEIKLLYEAISGKQLNATNFPNKLISLGLIVKLNEKKKIGAHRSPAYYQFNKKVYDKALKEGVVLV